MIYFSKRTLSRAVLAFIFTSLSITFQNCGTQNFQIDHASELPSSEIKSNDGSSNGGKSLSLAVPEIRFVSAPDSLNTALYTATFKFLELNRLS